MNGGEQEDRDDQRNFAEEVVIDGRGEKDLFKEIAPWLFKKEYRQVFNVPPEPWTIQAEWRETYFETATMIIRKVVAGELRPEVEGVAGIYLFRHYVELGIKYLIFHARFLKDGGQTNAEDEDIQEVKKTHNLRYSTKHQRPQSGDSDRSKQHAARRGHTDSSG